MQSKARITAIGTYVPEKKLTNDDLEKLVDTNDAWIVQRTGMKKRRITGDSEYASTLAFKAIENLVERYSACSISYSKTGENHIVMRRKESLIY